MPTFERKTMCAECPFRKKSAPGWLGPWSVDEFEQIINSDSQFVCHDVINKMSDDNVPTSIIEDVGQHCVGLLRYRNSLCRLSRDPEVAEVQRELRSVQDEEIIPAREFRTHHESIIKKRKKRN